MGPLTTSWNSRKPLTKVGRDVGDNELGPDDYRARDVALMAQSQIKGKRYADATTLAINRVQKFWNRHCAFMKVEPRAHLAACLAGNFKYYADWWLKNFNVKKQSTIWVEWKFLRLRYKREISRKIDEPIGEQISEYCFPTEIGSVIHD